MHERVAEAPSGDVGTSAWSIGIDFGTAFSKAAATRIASEHGAMLREIRPLRLGEVAGWGRPFLVPSTMFLDRSRIHFGPMAVERLIASGKDDREMARSFKTILGSSDFEGALDFYPRPSVDPDRAFRLRDLLVLYLAYLLTLVDQASASILTRAGGGVDSARVRFSRPGWIPGRIAAAHEVMSTLFTQAHLARSALGPALISRDGASYAEARAALDAARHATTRYESLDGGIYEASAVGVCHFSDRACPNALIIVDVGGGTTDVAGLLREPYSSDVRVVRTARRTIDVAGDDFDAALLDLYLEKSRLKSTTERTALWRSIVPHVREIKEEIFAKGMAEVSFRGRRFSCSAREFEAAPGFRSALQQIVSVYDHSLVEMVEAAKKARSGKIGVVLAGGGAGLPPLQRAIAKRRWLGFGVGLKHMPSTPKWAHQLESAKEFDILFAQLSAAFGAAISSSTMAQTTQT
jgi:molecular chaperone DnaK (HSP70)